ncbi:substrate-binding domain-containing protein [Streptomyces spiralis]
MRVDGAAAGRRRRWSPRHSDPPLSSVRQPTEETGRTMARVLPEEIESRTTVRRHVALSTDLVLRDSPCARRPRAHARTGPAAAARHGRRRPDGPRRRARSRDAPGVHGPMRRNVA